MLPAGAYVTTIVVGQARGTLDGDDLLNGVADKLSDIPLQVVTSKADVPGFLAGMIAGEWLHYDYTAQVTVKTPIRYENADAIGALVAQAFTDVSGSSPQSYSATSTSTAPVVPGVSPGWWQSLLDSVGSAGAAVNTDVHWLILGLVAIVVVLALAFMSPSGHTLIGAVA